MLPGTERGISIDRRSARLALADDAGAKTTRVPIAASMRSGPAAGADFRNKQDEFTTVALQP